MTVTPFKLSPEARKTIAGSSVATQAALDALAMDTDRRREEAARPQSWRDNLFTASDLRTLQFDPVRYMLPGFIPEGVTLLVGKPKIGKSWLALDLCLASADGHRYTLGMLKPRHGDCLYLALEDNKRRLKKRINKLLPDDSAWPARLTMVNEWKRSNEGGIDDLRAWCLDVKAGGGNPTLIQIDTLQKFRPIHRGSDSYATDYAAVTDLLSLTKEFPGLCIMVLHHDRKMDADDPFDTVSGTLGLTGAVDTILVLKRQSGTVKLFVRGRDVEESETALRFEKASCKWTMMTVEDTEASVSLQRQAVLDVLPLQPETMSIADIRAATGRDEKDTGIRKMLLDMKRDGQVVSTRSGFYSRPGNASNAVTVTQQPIEITHKNGSVTSVTAVTGTGNAETIDDADRPAAYWERL
jgi:hypothetical protein